MNTLLLRLVGPMQSWGTQSRFANRDTGREPSKSGVIGLLCAAMGRDRAEPIGDLASLRMGVRVDAEGSVARDYHTVLGVVKAGNPRKSDTVVSERYFLADAAFLVAFEGNDSQLPLLVQAHAALANPVWMLSLGRKAFVPSAPVYIDGGLIRGAGMAAALTNAPPLLGASVDPVRMVLECSPEEQTAVRMDQPVSFATRDFRPRPVKTTFINCSTLTTEQAR